MEGGMQIEYFSPIHDGMGRRGSGHLNQFFPGNFYKSRNNSTKKSDFLPRWCKISRLYLEPVQNCWTSTKTTSQIVIFLGNPYNIEVLITSLIETLELPNFGQIYNLIWITWYIFVGDVINLKIMVS